MCRLAIIRTPISPYPQPRSSDVAKSRKTILRRKKPRTRKPDVAGAMRAMRRKALAAAKRKGPDPIPAKEPVVYVQPTLMDVCRRAAERIGSGLAPYVEAATLYVGAPKGSCAPTEAQYDEARAQVIFEEISKWLEQQR